MSAVKFVGPLHIQVATALEQEIVEGAWPAGQPLPSEQALAKNYQVSLGTMRRALTTLVGRGLIERQRGRGTVVLRNTPSSVGRLAHRLDSFPQIVGFTAQVQDADEAVADRLGLPLGTRIMTAERLLALEDGSRIFEQVAWPTAFCTGLHDLDQISFDDWDREYRRLGISLGIVTESIAATEASDRVADLLDIDPGNPILVQTSLVSVDKVAMEHGVSYLALKNATFRVL